MLPYIFAFVISVALLYFAEVLRNNLKNLVFSRFVTGIALLLPCILAGGRDVGVGIDTLGYGAPVFEIACNTDNFRWYLDLVEGTGFDVNLLYSVVTYLVSRISHSVNLYFFVIQALMTFPFYFALRRLSGDRFLWLGFAVFYLLFYLQGLSNLRQFLAISFVLLAFAEYVDRRLLVSLALFCIGVGFHSTAAVWIILPLFWSVLFKKRQLLWHARAHAKIIVLFIFALGLFVVVNIQQVFSILTSFPLLGRYASYLETDTASSFVSLYPAFGAMFVGILLDINKIECTEIRHKALFFVGAAFLTFPLWFLQSFNRQFGRMSIYAWAFFPIALVYVLNNIDRYKAGDVPLTLGSVFSLLGSGAYCAWVYVLNDSFNTAPYLSKIFGII